LRRDGLVLNPSYYNFVALRAMASLVPDARWQMLEQSGMDLLLRAQFGSWRVPTDWVEYSAIDDRIRPAPGWPERFSWDAIRIPLNLVWAGEFRSPVLQNLVRFWANKKSPHLGAWLDIAANRRFVVSANSGLSAIADLTRQAVSMKDQNLDAYQVETAHNYYDAALMILARIAARESGLSKISGTPISLAWLRALG
jgi:endoglucanase